MVTSAIEFLLYTSLRYSLPHSARQFSLTLLTYSHTETRWNNLHTNPSNCLTLYLATTSVKTSSADSPLSSNSNSLRF